MTINKSCVRVLLLLFVGLLGVEYKLSMAGIEPYPTVMYPEFSYLLPQTRSIPVNKPDFVVTFENGDTEKVNYYELFNNVPISHVNHLVVLNLNPESRVHPERFQNKNFRTFQLGRYTFEWRHTPNSYTREEIQERDTFLKERIRIVTGREDIDFLHITWYEYDFIFGEGRDLKNRRKRYEARFGLDGKGDA
jgi:hypothetical protein